MAETQEISLKSLGVVWQNHNKYHQNPWGWSSRNTRNITKILWGWCGRNTRNISEILGGGEAEAQKISLKILGGGVAETQGISLKSLGVLKQKHKKYL